jgi:hypothetical protein
MSGFVANLVQRSLTTVAAVRPRPLSVFEPSQPSPVSDTALAPVLEMEQSANDSERGRTDRNLPSAQGSITRLDESAATTPLPPDAEGFLSNAKTEIRPARWRQPLGDRLSSDQHAPPHPTPGAGGAPAPEAHSIRYPLAPVSGASSIAVFETELAPTGGDRTRRNRDQPSVPHPTARAKESAPTTAAPGNADEPESIVRTAIRPDPRRSPVEDPQLREGKEPAEHAPHPGEAPASFPKADYGRDSFARVTTQTAAMQAPEGTPIPSGQEPGSPDDPVAARSRRLHLRGKPVVSADPNALETSRNELTPEQQGLIAPAVPVQKRGSEPPAPVADAEHPPRIVAPVTVTTRGSDRDEPTTLPSAILKPRLQAPEPIAWAAQPPMSQPAEPIVHVTIGRVEIRAVPAPSAPKRTAPPKPTLSLGDYLRRRNGGGE